MSNAFARKVSIALLALLSVWHTHAADGAHRMPLEITIAPFLPPQIFVQNYQPLRAYLEQRLGQPVVLLTAPDFRTFNQRLLRGELPFAIAVANSAQLAIAEAGYVPLLRPTTFTRPVVVVAKDSTINRIADLKNRHIATTDTMSTIAMQSAQMLREADIHPEDVRIKHLLNHSAAVNYVVSREVEAAIVSDRALLQMPDATRDAVRVVATWEPGAAPGVVYLAARDVPREQAAKVRQAILDFVQQTEEGRNLVARFGYGTLVPANADDLRFLAPYGTHLKALLTDDNP
jgi:phosphonate transport system substrate-binding protein